MPVTVLDYDISLVSQGKEIPAFGLVSEHEDSVSCCVTSVANREFQVQLHNRSEEGYSVDFDVYMDGRKMGRHVADPNEKITMKGVYETSTSCRPFQFSQLHLKEIDDPFKDYDVTKVGIIEVRIYRVIAQENVREAFAPRKAAENLSISEETKQIGLHVVTLGKSKAMHGPAIVPTLTFLDPHHEPHAVCRFMYRPKGFWKMKGLLPKAKVPEGIEVIDCTSLD